MFSSRNILIIILLIIIIIIIFFYIKLTLLYHPYPVLQNKYEKFYQKLIKLTETKNHIYNFSIRTIDNVLLDTIYINNPDTKRCIIYFHGNTGNISMRFEVIKFLYNYCSVVAFDYRSFGKSSGNFYNLSSFTLRKDALAIWDFTTNKLGYSANNISLFGESLGCSIILDLVAELSKTFDYTQFPHSLVLNSPFYSLSSMINLYLNKINLGFLSRVFEFILGYEYKSNESIKYINHQTKIIFAHSLYDEVIPFDQGLNLFRSIEKYRKDIYFIILTGTHNNLKLTDTYIYLLADIFMN